MKLQIVYDRMIVCYLESFSSSKSEFIIEKVLGQDAWVWLSQPKSETKEMQAAHLRLHLALKQTMSSQLSFDNQFLELLVASRQVVVCGATANGLAPDKKYIYHWFYCQLTSPKLRSKWWNLLHPWHQPCSWLPNRAGKYVIRARD